MGTLELSNRISLSRVCVYGCPHRHPCHQGHTDVHQHVLYGEASVVSNPISLPEDGAWSLVAYRSPWWLMILGNPPMILTYSSCGTYPSYEHWVRSWELLMHLATRCPWSPAKDCWNNREKSTIHLGESNFFQDLGAIRQNSVETMTSQIRFCWLLGQGGFLLTDRWFAKFPQTIIGRTTSCGARPLQLLEKSWISCYVSFSKVKSWHNHSQILHISGISTNIYQ